MEYTKETYRRSLPREHGFESLRVEGNLPPSLSGTLYRNGPGMFPDAGHVAAHPLTAKGVVSGVRIHGAAAMGACRVVQPVAALFGDALHPANTHVVSYAGHLLALNEGRSPVELSSDNLDTLGEYTFGGSLISAFSAHPHRIEARRTTFNVGVEHGKTSRLHIYELPDQGPFRHHATIDLPWAPLLHDFALTGRYLVAFVSPLCFRPLYRQLELGGMADWYEWQPHRGTEVIVIPLAAPSAPVRFTVEPFFQWHFINAFERGSTLIVDYVRFPDASPFVAFTSDAPWAPFANARCHRATLDVVHRTLTTAPLSEVACDFPRIDPRAAGAEYQTAWALAADLRSLVRLDCGSGTHRRWVLPEGQWASEPVFVPESHAAHESAGHVLSLCFDSASDCSFLAVLDAERLEDGPVARVWFDQYVPGTFHGSWVELTGAAV